MSHQQPAHGSGTPVRRAGMLYATGSWCARHFVVVIVLWIAGLVALQAVQHAYGGDYSDNFAIPGTQSQDGLDVLEKHALGRMATAARWWCTTRTSPSAG